MLSHRDIRKIRVDAIDFGRRRQTPSETEIDQMVKSIEQEGLLAPIAVQRTGENSYRLLCGATRLSAARRLGWLEVPATVLEGTEVDAASAEIVENLTRRHLDTDQRDELTRAYVALRSTQQQNGLNGSWKELNDNVSHNSFQKPNTHPKVRVEGSKRGRPPTPASQSKKEAASLTGQSLRSVQRATSTKPKGATSVDRDSRRLDNKSRIEHQIREIKRLLSSSVFNDNDRQQLRKQNQPFLNGFIAEFGKLLFTVEAEPEGVGAENDNG
jgi:ParB/Sulfiredoxin domain